MNGAKKIRVVLRSQFYPHRRTAKNPYTRAVLAGNFPDDIAAWRHECFAANHRTRAGIRGTLQTLQVGAQLGSRLVSNVAVFRKDYEVPVAVSEAELRLVAPRRTVTARRRCGLPLVLV